VADSLEKRVADLEYMLAHVPEDLDARFAGLDVRFADLRELILLQSNRFTKLEARFNEAVAKLTLRIDELARKAEVQGKEFSNLAGKVEVQGKELSNLAGKVEVQGKELSNLAGKVEVQGKELRNLAGRAEVQGTEFRNLAGRVDTDLKAVHAKLDAILARLPRP
jgi:chromosome segregation ATPase